MVIQCEKCNRKYRLDDSRINPPGSSVRCSKCGHIFFVSMKEDTESKKELIISDDTPLFEDLKEEITTEYEEVAETPVELTQGELKIEEQTDETNDELLDLPTEHEENLEEFIDRDVTDDIDDVNTEPVNDVSLEDTTYQNKEPELGEAEIPENDHPELLEVNNDSRIDEVETIDGQDLEPNSALIDNTETNVIEPKFDEGSFDSSNINLEKSGSGFLAKFVYTLITIAAVLVILIASIVLLINAEILPKGTLSGFTKLVPAKLNNSEESKIIITDHKARWMNTVNGPIYIVSGLITNESVVPVNFVKLRSEYIAAEDKQYEDVFYAGNTFTDKELKDTPIADILLRLDQKNGDIDVNNSRKLAGLNYNIRPGESIPFFSVFPAEGRMLGLKYNLEVIEYEEAPSN